MKIAAAAYPPQWHPATDALAARLDAWVGDAAAQGADLLVFPEYAGIEAGLIGQPGQDVTGLAWRDRLAPLAEGWVELHAELARRHRVHLLAGSIPTATGAGVVNRAVLCAPDGTTAHQDKLILTPYERSAMGMTPGDGLRLIDTVLGRIGVLICYDSEFPLLARALVAAGADMILVPSCTDLPAGQTRVRASCRARAVEGQCLVVQAPLLGRVPGCGIVDVSTGRAGIFCPPDHGLPADGIVAQGATDVPGWTCATVDPAAIAAARTTGQVGNFVHWAEQDGRINSVTTLRTG